MAWRNCNASMSLIAAINVKWPRRDKTTDGTIGDAAHATRVSDHNPWIKVNGVGVVRARDIDKDGIDAAWLAEQLRLAGLNGDTRLTGGGYVIFNRRITTPDFKGWKAYTGINPHTAHIHVSFSQNPAGFDRRDGWVFLDPAAPKPVTAPKPAPAPVTKYTWKTAPVLQLGSQGHAVKVLQDHLRRKYPDFAGHLVIDGDFGAATDKAVRIFQVRSGLVADGIVGPASYKAMVLYV